MRRHLAIISKQAIEAILSGRKTIETRFSQKRIDPFGRISLGDIVYLKPPGKEVAGRFKVKKVFYYEGLNSQDIMNIFKEFGNKIATGDKKSDKSYMNSKQYSHYGTLIFIAESERFITSPIKIRKSDLRGWVVLD